MYNIIGVIFQSQGDFQGNANHACMNEHFSENLFGENANYSQKESSEGAILRMIALKNYISRNYPLINNNIKRFQND